MPYLQAIGQVRGAAYTIWELIDRVSRTEVKLFWNNHIVLCVIMLDKENKPMAVLRSKPDIVVTSWDHNYRRMKHAEGV